MPERKTLPVEWKAESDGNFRARFSVFNEIDLDGDVTLPGAFTSGAPVRIAQWGHNWGALPVGKGVIGADETKAWADAGFFLDTTHGSDTYKTVKELGDLQEWSYGFDVIEADFGQFQGKEVRFLKKLNVFEVSPVMRGAGTDTGTEFIKGTFEQDAEHALAAVTRFTDRAKALVAMRAKEGRVLSNANRDRLKAHMETLRSMATELEQLLTDTEPKESPDLRREYLRLMATEARLNGVAV